MLRNTFFILFCIVGLSACTTLSSPPVVLSPCVAVDNFSGDNPCVKRPVNTVLSRTL